MSTASEEQKCSQHKHKQLLESDILHFAFKCNNTGVQLIDVGNRDDAFELFQGAIELMLHYQTSSCASMKSFRNTRFIQTAKELIMKVQSTDNNATPLGPKVHLPITIQCNFSNSSGFVYKHGFMIQQRFMKLYEGNQEALCQFMSSRMVYNIGLIHHLAYLDGPGHNQLLGAALNLYNKADHLIDEATSNQSISDDFILDPLRMIILNNMAVAYHDEYDYDACKANLQRLSIFILESTSHAKNRMALVENVCDMVSIEHYVTSIGNRFVEHFLMNILYLKKPNTAGAA